MYSYEQRIKAVELLIQYDMSYAAVVRELGYPNDVHSLRNWYKEYKDKGDLNKAYPKIYKFTEEQKKTAVQYYLEHGKNASKTCKKLGYPSRPQLRLWLEELVPEEKKHCRSSCSSIKYSREHKEKAVIALCSRTTNAKEVAAEFGTTRENLYNWRRQLLKEEAVVGTKANDFNDADNTKEELLEEIKQLKAELNQLNKDVYRAKLERDIYEKAAEVIKKDQGVSLENLTNQEKAIVIGALRDKYKLKELLPIFKMAKSSYCYQEAVLNLPDKYSDMRNTIKSIFDAAHGRYGYRRIYTVLKNNGIKLSEKVVLRIMNEDNLHVKNIKNKKYSSYKGEISPEVPNVVQRDFHADKPNLKWLTDITEFGIPAGKVYLSPIIDCFDGLPVSWTIGTSPDADLVNEMLDMAIATLGEGERPIVHSDRGCHYRWPGWIERMENNGLTRSMSKKGCSPDNSACEGFFGRLKNEMFYGEDWKDVSIKEFIDILNDYIHWYAEERIKVSLGGMSPLQYRKKLGLAV